MIHQSTGQESKKMTEELFELEKETKNINKPMTALTIVIAGAFLAIGVFVGWAVAEEVPSIIATGFCK